MSKLTGLLNRPGPIIMGVLNVTPDSFSDGGRFVDPEIALSHAREMINAGADIIDIGGESTRPGADPVSPQEEIDRVMPVISLLRKHEDCAISLDTSTAELMQAACAERIDLINDVRALRRDNALEVAADSGVPVCLMHMQGDPATMQMNPRYEDLVPDINAFFVDRIEACEEAGIPRDRILLDPGFGFGKTPHHNLVIINRLQAFGVHGCPLLVGLSRKSTIAKITPDRTTGSVAGALLAVMNGARIVRVHDVAETVSALRVLQAVTAESREFD